IIVPQSFPVIMQPEIPLLQLRFIQGERRFLSITEQENLQQEKQIVSNTKSAIEFTENGVVLNLDLQGTPKNLVATVTGKPLDLSKRDEDATIYFSEKSQPNDSLFLEPEQFLLASLIEHVRIPPHLCAEMLPFR